MTSSSDKEEEEEEEESTYPHSHSHYHQKEINGGTKEEGKGKGGREEGEKERNNTVDDQLTTTQKNKYSHRHVHLTYIYLLQTFGELMGHIEDSIMTSVEILPSIGEQIMSRYDDLKKQSNAVSKVINELKKGISGREGVGTIKKQEHEFSLQTYKLQGTARECHHYRHQEMTQEYQKILRGLKNNTKEYVELCQAILGEYDRLNRRKEHKEKELLTRKLNHISKHEKEKKKN
ncbi:hypothetical protein PIROE2DRAFT_17529 [Piromyces sp. E2]|nr:hypothetical protein PIROE2DRAFT_17529 [Piromyces sp. E2]|eukprot:OUM57478.1 hypothetical protein PIROE2DRAFT_17529 [Piromyces sp. E2]